MSKTNRRTERLQDRVALWAARLKVKPRLVRIQRLTRKWGSCSTAGTITLAADLNDQEVGFQDFVIAHELLHLRVPNHSRLFKVLMTVHVPQWRTFDALRNDRRVSRPRS
jgi:predicted metal-dependent hydrolase